MRTDVLRNMESGSLQRTFKWFREHCMSVCVCVQESVSVILHMNVCVYYFLVKRG